MRTKSFSVLLAVLALPAFASLEDVRTLAARFAQVESVGDAVDAMSVSVFAPDVAKAKDLVARQRADGSWAEVDYVSDSRSAWKPGVGHVRERALFLARQYYRHRDPAVGAAAKKALDYWAAAGHRCSNWWWNIIGAPQDFGVAAVLIDDLLTDADRARYADYLECTQIGRTGQNRVWQSRVVMMRGMLRRDEALIDKAVEAIAGEVVVSDGAEGVAADWSFRQHGPQMQFGNYGASYILNMSRLARVFATTKWSLPQEKLSVIGNLEEKGYRWTLWNGNLDVSCLGRQFTPDAQRRKARAITLAMDEFAQAGWQFPTEPLTGFKLFPLSAYAVYRPGGWMASVKMNTREVLETETWINGENTLGGHLSDGALFVYVTGREYADIAPLWKNWRLIPGVTSYVDLPPVQRRYNEGPGANESSDMTGAGTAKRAALDFTLKRDGLTVRKHWRFTPDGVVCRGEILSATNAASRVATCVEHTLAQPNAQILPYANGSLTVVNGAVTYLIHAPEAAIQAKIEERTGDWTGIHPPSVDRSATGRVLEIFIDHGVQPVNATYHYEIRIRN